MKLTDKDYEAMAELMEDGDSCIEYKKNGETLYIDYNIDTDGYTEDDYFDGTGAYVCTYANCRINEYTCEDADGETVACNLDENKLKTICEDYILAL